MKAFTTWTVLKHGPLQQHGERFWTVDGSMPNSSITRVMSIARLEDGRLVIHNAIALEEEAMKALEALGVPAFLIVPNGYHRMDARIWKDRYPGLTVLCPRGARNKVAQVVPVDGSLDGFPMDPHVKVRHLAGMKDAEGVLMVEYASGTVLVFNDTLMNQRPLQGLQGFMVAPTGILSVPRILRWAVVKDKRALANDLRALAAATNLRRLVVSHGAPITERIGEQITAAANRLEG